MGKVELPFANDGSFMEQFLKQQQPQLQLELEQPSEQPKSTCGSEPEESIQRDEQISATVSESDFIPSQSFMGAKSGFVYKNDEKGLGYYKDIGPPRSTEIGKPAQGKPQRPVPGKPVVLKTNNPIVNAKPRSIGALPSSENKKRKLDESEKDKPFYLKELERYRQQSCGSGTVHDRPLVK